MKNNSIHTSTVRTLSHEGRGIVHANKKTFFLTGALPNEQVTFRSRGKHAQLLSGDCTHPNRRPPACHAFLQCGGCQLQHLEEDVQLQHKNAQLIDLLTHLGRVPRNDYVLEPTLTGPTLGYRHRARLSGKWQPQKDPPLLIGFREQQGKYVQDMHHCLTLSPRLSQHIQPLRRLLSQAEHPDTIPQIEVVDSQGDALFLIRHLKPFSDSLVQALKHHAETEQISIGLQGNPPQPIQWLTGKPNLFYTLSPHEHRFEFTHEHFTQVNPYINQAMITQALDWLSLSTTDRVLDAYCGIGNFSLSVAPLVQHVYGFELSKLSIEQAKTNALKNHLPHLEFRDCNLEEIPHDFPWPLDHNVLILDPPRSGAKTLLHREKHPNVNTILYVSCHASTFARDMGLLYEWGFKLSRVGLMDMFPQTKHSEVMGLLHAAE